MKNICKSVFLYVWFIVVFSSMLMCLMYSVYLIPVEKIRPNVAKSVVQISAKPIFSFYSFGGAQDTFTDTLMLNEVSFWGRDPLQDALLNPRVEPHGRWDQYGDLVIGLNTQGLQNLPIIDYGRYVHGYLLFLKPLFVFCDLQTIRKINLFLHAILLALVLFLLCRRLNFKYSLAYLFSIFFLNPLTTWQCLVYSIDVNITLLATLWVLLNKNPNNRYMFFIIGAVVVFDFPCFPLLSLGMPLIIYICLYERSFKENIKCVVKNSLLWGAGYAGMMVCKWILATLLTDQNIILDGWQNVLYRMNGEQETLPFLTALKVNLAEYYHIETIWCFLLFVISIVILYFIRPYRLKITSKVLIILGIGLMPFVWYIAMRNHSFIHHFFTYRILIVSIYAVFTALVCCLQNKESEKNRNNYLNYENVNQPTGILFGLLYFF